MYNCSSITTTASAPCLDDGDHDYSVRRCSVKYIGFGVVKMTIELENPRQRYYPDDWVDGKPTTKAVKKGPRDLVFNVSNSSVSDDGPDIEKIAALDHFIMDVFDVELRFTPSTIDAFRASIKEMIRTAWKEAKHVKTVLRGRRCNYKGTGDDKGRGCIERCMIGNSFCFVHSVSHRNKVMEIWECFDAKSELAKAHNNGVDKWDSTITYSCRCRQTEKYQECYCIVNDHHMFKMLPPLCIKMIFAVLDARQRCLLGLSCMELLQFFDTIKIEERPIHIFDIFNTLHPRWIKIICELLNASERDRLQRSCTLLWKKIQRIC